MLSFYNLSAPDGHNKTVDFSSLKGKVVIIVNVASLCGFSSQYSEFEKLYQKYKDDGLVVMAFPCNQFGGQEPDLQENLEDFIRSKFQVSFPVMKKVDVNGDNTCNVYQYLKNEKAGPLGFKGVRWNFEKFIIDRNGKVVARQSSGVTPSSMEPAINILLK